MRLPSALEAYRIPRPSQNPEERAQAVRDSLRFLSLAPDRITFPLLAGVYRAALGQAGFSLFLAGPSGVFKSTLAALCQQHFGAGMNSGGLPAGFGSTAYALEELAFYAKDALLVVDDFAPNGPRDHALEGIAEVLFRAAGNRQGRGRLGKDGQPGAGHAPRALVLATGEQVPQGLSLRARLLTIDVAAGEVNRSALTECQKAAQQGHFAASMSAFLSWTAGQYEVLQQRLAARTEELRGHFQTNAAHARLPSAAAALAAGFEIFLAFAVETGAVGDAERQDLLERSRRALDQLIARQTRDSQTADPALRFLQLLRAALSEGHAHVCDRVGKALEEPTAWGWRRQPSGRAWVPQGARIGWIVGPDLFLDPSASYQIAQQMAGNQPLARSPQALRHRLHERTLLASVDCARHMLLVRRTLEGHPRKVLHMKAGALVK